MLLVLLLLVVCEGRWVGGCSYLDCFGVCVSIALVLVALHVGVIVSL